MHKEVKVSFAYISNYFVISNFQRRSETYMPSTSSFTVALSETLPKNYNLKYLVISFAKNDHPLPLLFLTCEDVTDRYIIRAK